VDVGAWPGVGGIDAQHHFAIVVRDGVGHHMDSGYLLVGVCET